jgi:protein-tyrosine-phosphatase
MFLIHIGFSNTMRVFILQRKRTTKREIVDCYYKCIEVSEQTRDSLIEEITKRRKEINARRKESIDKAS